MLVSIPAWEAKHSRTFMVNGESVLLLLLAAAGPLEKENHGKKKPESTGRSGSVPPRATTPTPFTNGASTSNHHNYAPSSSTNGNGKGVVTPAVRPAPGSSSQSVPNKRPRLAASTSSIPSAGRTALGVSRGAGMNGRSSPPTVSRMRGKTPKYTSLPKPVPIPKPGTQHHALGHGRAPSTQQRSQPQPRLGSSTNMRTTSDSSTRALKNTGRKRRESFKPRPSMDADWSGGDKRWVANAVVTEEDEDC